MRKPKRKVEIEKKKNHITQMSGASRQTKSHMGEVEQVVEVMNLPMNTCGDVQPQSIGGIKTYINCPPSANRSQSRHVYVKYFVSELQKKKKDK